VVAQLSDFLVHRCRFDPTALRFVPVAAFQGDNVATLLPKSPFASWGDEGGVGGGAVGGDVGGRPPTLAQAIDAFGAVGRPLRRPLRVIVTDCAPSGKGVAVTGQVSLQGP